MTSTNSEPFLTDGISLGIPSTNATSVESIDNAIFLDSDGKLHFRDNFIKSLGTDVDGLPLTSITLEDLYYRVKGIYAKNGKLYFKDSSVSRPYSLKELIGAYTDWKNKLTTGGIFWIGNTRVTGSECNNIKVNVNGDPNLPINTVTGLTSRIFTKLPQTNDYINGSNGTKVFSIDNYLDEYMTTNPNPSNLDYYRFNDDGSWKWHDVPNLKILVPPLDLNKAIYLFSKIEVRLIKTVKPIVFRIYDKTTDVELDRKAVANDSYLPSTQQPALTYVGKMPEIAGNTDLTRCDCSTSDSSVSSDTPHELLIQFHVDDTVIDNVYSQQCQFKQDDVLCLQGETVEGAELYTPAENRDVIKYHRLERRLIGLPHSLEEEPIIKSSIDIIVYDISKEDSVGRKAGNAQFNAINKMDITFSVPFTSADYTITLSSNKNVHSWYTNKKSTGFTIMTENKFTGTVDWIATKLKFEGNA